MLKRSNPGKSNLYPNFIGSWMLETRLCDELIDYFEDNSLKHHQGVSSGGLNLNAKSRKDISITPKEINLPGNEVFKKYFEQLYNFYKDYNVQWPFLRSITSRLEIGSFNLGKYQPGEHFQELHTERCGLSTLHRLLVFMTYLNDVEEGGSTYFTHYDLDIKPRKGLTIIWPAEWTHAHRGNVLKKGSKYIITGWLNFAKNE